jgi:polyprenyl-phospho-N-acetylgalactosaminyl synthase
MDPPADDNGARTLGSRARVVIPAHDEAPVIAGVVSELRAAGWPVVVVDDGSTDDTAAVARRAGAEVVRHPVNLGQGAALQTGIDYAIARGADIVVTFDADGQHSVDDVGRLVAALEGADVALGSRFLGSTIGMSRARGGFLRLAVVVSNALSGLRLTDTHCGLRAFRASVAPRLRMRQNRMAHASEILRKIRESGLAVAEVPVTIRYTDYSRRKGQSMLGGVRILIDLLFRREG